MCCLSVTSGSTCARTYAHSYLLFLPRRRRVKVNDSLRHNEKFYPLLLSHRRLRLSRDAPEKSSTEKVCLRTGHRGNTIRRSSGYSSERVASRLRVCVRRQGVKSVRLCYVYESFYRMLKRRAEVTAFLLPPAPILNSRERSAMFVIFAN